MFLFPFRRHKGKGRQNKHPCRAELRLQKDLDELTFSRFCAGQTLTRISFPGGSKAAQKLKFHCVITPQEGLWAGGSFTFEFSVPPAYPFEPPTIQCLTKVLHPNIDWRTGNVALSLLTKGEWKPVLSINTVIFGLQLLFLQPYEDNIVTDEVRFIIHKAGQSFPGLVADTLRGGVFFGEQWPAMVTAPAQKRFRDDTGASGDHEPPHSASGAFGSPQEVKVKDGWPTGPAQAPSVETTTDTVQDNRSPKRLRLRSPWRRKRNRFGDHPEDVHPDAGRSVTPPDMTRTFGAVRPSSPSVIQLKLLETSFPNMSAAAYNDLLSKAYSGTGGASRSSSQAVGHSLSAMLPAPLDDAHQEDADSEAGEMDTSAVDEAELLDEMPDGDELTESRGPGREENARKRARFTSRDSQPLQALPAQQGKPQPHSMQCGFSFPLLEPVPSPLAHSVLRPRDTPCKAVGPVLFPMTMPPIQPPRSPFDARIEHNPFSQNKYLAMPSLRGPLSPTGLFSPVGPGHTPSLQSPLCAAGVRRSFPTSPVAYAPLPS